MEKKEVEVSVTPTIGEFESPSLSQDLDEDGSIMNATTCIIADKGGDDKMGGPDNSFQDEEDEQSVKTPKEGEQPGISGHRPVTPSTANTSNDLEYYKIEIGGEEVPIHIEIHGYSGDKISDNDTHDVSVDMSPEAVEDSIDQALHAVIRVNRRQT
jgi:hypothetical protein